MNIIRHYEPLGVAVSNLGDNLVECGAAHLLKDYQGTAVIGTPWFWHGAWLSEKYTWLGAQLDALPAGTKAVACGIGTAVPLGYGLEMLMEEANVEACKRLWGRFHALSTRDEISHEFLTAIGIESTLLPCPSVLAAEALDLRFIDPRPGSALFIDCPSSNESMQWAREEANVPRPWRHDFDTFLYRRGHYTENHLANLLFFWQTYETIISARIHAALPLAPYRKVAVVPLDSRYLTATGLGVSVWPAEPVCLPHLPELAKSEWQAWLTKEGLL